VMDGPRAARLWGRGGVGGERGEGVNCSARRRHAPGTRRYAELRCSPEEAYALDGSASPAGLPTAGLPRRWASCRHGGACRTGRGFGGESVE